MESTLRSFIDPANIPKKYGGELDFTFGDMPKLDPALKDVLTWENGHTDFPHGPLYWIDKGEYIELKAVGSVDKVDRDETICKVKKTVHDNDVTEKSSTRPISGSISTLRPELFSIPTAKDGVPLAKLEKDLLSNGDANTVTPSETAITEPKVEEPTVDAGETAASDIPKSEAKAIEAGELVPESRPEPVSFHTAQEGITALSLKEVTNEDTSLLNGAANGPHKSALANMLDPTVNQKEN
jgi:hypothetical protein